MAQVPDRIIITFEYNNYPKPPNTNVPAAQSNFTAANDLFGYLDTPTERLNRFSNMVSLASAVLSPSSNPQPSNVSASVRVEITDPTSITNFVNDPALLFAD